MKSGISTAVGDRAEMRVEPALIWLVVVGCDHEHCVGAGLLGVLCEVDRFFGRF